jgi:hypothetical protein
MIRLGPCALLHHIRLFDFLVLRDHRHRPLTTHSDLLINATQTQYAKELQPHHQLLLLLQQLQQQHKKDVRV